MTYRKAIATSLILGATLMAATPAQATDHPSPARTATLVGQYIADQGNAALIQIRKELKQDLADALRPLLPAPDRVGANADKAKARTN